mmetsp:Transcript_27112/g.41523  ORF Transcript_27112/g.41523 Transcript_27112/m.41523 type:complete len:899 (+) Transcript_27112:114-2810(+)
MESLKQNKVRFKNNKISPADKVSLAGDISIESVSMAEQSGINFAEEEPTVDFLESRITAILERKGLVDTHKEHMKLKPQVVVPQIKSRGYFNPYRNKGPKSNGDSVHLSEGKDDESSEGEDGEEEEDTESPLAESTYSLMMVSKVSGKGYIVGLVTFIFEIVLLSLIFADQLAASDSSTIFDVPFRVSPIVRIGQFITILIVVLTSSDTLTSVKNLAFFAGLYRRGEAEDWWREVFPDDHSEYNEKEADVASDNDQEHIDRANEHKHSSVGLNISNIGPPEVDSLKMTARGIADDSPLDLDLDDSNGKIASSEEIEQALKRALRRTFFLNILLPNMFSLTQSLLVLLVSFVIIVQSDNIIDLLKDFTSLMFISEINDIVFYVASIGYLGRELKRDTKRSQSFEITDSLQVMTLCSRLIPARVIFLAFLAIALLCGWLLIVAGQVSGTYFKYKFEDCNIPTNMVANLGNDECDGGVLNSIECGFDGGDCVDFNLAWPDCYVPDAFKVGDGKCDELYNKEKCGYDGGDCCPYASDDEHFFNGVCDGGYYNTQACGFDNGDCDEINLMYPVCPFEILASRIGTEMFQSIIIGDGICQSGIYLLDECFFEGGDCVGCVENANIDPELVGNGFCNGREYMSDACGNDGGDCDECFVDDPMKVGNGICDGGAYDSEGCSFDGGDCLIKRQPNLALPTNSPPTNSPTGKQCEFRWECSDPSVQFRPISKYDNATIYAFTPEIESFVVSLPFTYSANLGTDGVLTVDEVEFNCRTNIFIEETVDKYFYVLLMHSDNDPGNTLDMCSSDGGTDGKVATYQNEDATSFLISYENIGSDAGIYANVQAEFFSDGSINYCFGEGDISSHHIWSYLSEYSDIHKIQGEPFNGKFFVDTFPSNNCYCFECIQ